MAKDIKSMTPEEKLLYYFGVTDFPKKLASVIDIFGEEPKMISFLINMEDKGDATINIYCPYKVMVDNKKPKNINSQYIELSLAKGLHIVRVVVDKAGGGIIKNGLSNFDPEPQFKCDSGTCEAIYVSDSITIKSRDQLTKNLKNFKRVIFGKSCEVSSDIARWENIGEITVVDDNELMECKDGCIIGRSWKKNLIYAGPDVEVLPTDISRVEDYALRICNGEKLIIPGSVRRLNVYDIESNPKDHTNIKELVFEEGVEEIHLNHFIFSENMTVKFPKSLKSLGLFCCSLGKVLVPNTVATLNCYGSKITDLDIEGDITLMGEYNDAFGKFSGNVKFDGNVIMPQKTESGEYGSVCVFGTTKDDCTVTVNSQELADVIKNSKDFNKNAKVIVG